MTAVSTEHEPDPRVGRSLTVVHLSDLHFGPSHRFEFQTTAAGDRVAGGQSLLGSLKADLASALPQQIPETSAPVLIAVTGDLTDAATPEQFQEAAAFILDLEKSLEDRSAQAVIVPGNHDVLWEQADIENRLSAWRGFARDRLNRNVVGQLDHPFARVHDEYVTSHGTIIAAINSAGFVEKSKPDQNRGRISPDGIDDLDDQLGSLPADDTLLRIALVHHHPILIPDLVEAKRGYDAIVDGGDLLQVLRRHGFHLILHGHKHLPFNFSEDSRAAYSTRQPREQRPILVVCGGSVGSSEISDRMQTPTNFYNILRIKWLPTSRECRSRIEPRHLVRYSPALRSPAGNGAGNRASLMTAAMNRHMPKRTSFHCGGKKFPFRTAASKTRPVSVSMKATGVPSQSLRSDLALFSRRPMRPACGLSTILSRMARRSSHS